MARKFSVFRKMTYLSEDKTAWTLVVEYFKCFTKMLANFILSVFFFF